MCAAVVGDAAGVSDELRERQELRGSSDGFVFVADLPRNTMGKVIKADVADLTSSKD